MCETVRITRRITARDCGPINRVVRELGVSRFVKRLGFERTHLVVRENPKDTSKVTISLTLAFLPTPIKKRNQP